MHKIAELDRSVTRLSGTDALPRPNCPVQVSAVCHHSDTVALSGVYCLVCVCYLCLLSAPELSAVCGLLSCGLWSVVRGLLSVVCGLWSAVSVSVSPVWAEAAVLAADAG